MKTSRPKKNVYLVFGGDDYLVSRRVDEIVSALVSDVGEGTAVERVDCEEVGLEGVIEEMVSPSLFSLNKITVLRHFRLAAENKLAREIEAYLASGLAPGQFLVIEAAKVDKRLKLAKLVEAGGTLEEVRPLGQGEVRPWIVERFKEHGKRVSAGVVELLLDLKGDDLRAISSEIDKAATYVGDQEEVTDADLRALVGRSRTERIFELVKHVIAGQTGKALETVADLLDTGDSGTRVVAYIGREVRWLIQIKLFLRSRPGLWDSGMTFQEFNRITLPAFRAWTEACRIEAGQTFLHQNPYASYMKFKESLNCDFPKLLAMLEQLVEANRFLVSMSVEDKERLALETFVSGLAT